MHAIEVAASRATTPDGSEPEPLNGAFHSIEEDELPLHYIGTGHNRTLSGATTRAMSSAQIQESGGSRRRAPAGAPSNTGASSKPAPAADALPTGPPIRDVDFDHTGDDDSRRKPGRTGGEAEKWSKLIPPTSKNRGTSRLRPGQPGWLGSVRISD